MSPPSAFLPVRRVIVCQACVSGHTFAPPDWLDRQRMILRHAGMPRRLSLRRLRSFPSRQPRAPPLSTPLLFIFFLFLWLGFVPNNGTCPFPPFLTPTWSIFYDAGFPATSYDFSAKPCPITPRCVTRWYDSKNMAEGYLPNFFLAANNFFLRESEYRFLVTFSTFQR